MNHVHDWSEWRTYWVEVKHHAKIVFHQQRRCLAWIGCEAHETREA